MKKFPVLILAALLMISLLSGCGEEKSEAAAPKEGANTVIDLNGGKTQIKGSGAAAKESLLHISAGGSYLIKGELNEGQILVDTGEAPADVKIILEGVTVTNSAEPAILVKQAKNTHIELAAGSENLLRSGVEGMSPAEDASGAVIYCEDDLDIEGEGSLKIEGYINNGIGCKDDLDIKGGSIELYAVNNGIRASESVEIKGGSLNIQAGNDGIKTTSSKKEGKGFVEISEGLLNINAAGDGISAETELRINGGDIKIKAEADGIKSNSDAEIAGGSVFINAAEDGIQTGDKKLSSVKNLLISDGELKILSGKQAIDSPKLQLSGGSLLALQDAEPRAGFENLGSQSYILEALKGAEGSVVSAMGNELKSERGFKALLFSSPELKAGESFSVMKDAEELIFTAK